MKKILVSCLVAILATSCVSTRSTLKNVDETAQSPQINKNKVFIITEVSTDKKYGYDKNYPVNLGFLPIQSAEINIKRYFGALAGPQGQPITYTKADTCCPFPSKHNEMGAGIIDIYEVTWAGLAQPLRIHINLYEKGKVMAPAGLTIAKQ